MNGAGLKQSLYFAMPAGIQTALVSAYGRRLFRKRYGAPFSRILARVEQVAALGKAQIDDLKFERLKAILGHAETNVPYYARLFKEIGFTAGSMQDFEDLQRIPPLEKETLRRHQGEFAVRNIRKHSYALQTTSGSTGTPISIHVDELTYKLAMALVVNHEQMHGVRFGDRRATFAGRMVQKIDNNRPPFCRFNKSENQMIFSAYHIGLKNVQSYIDDLNDFRPEEIIGYPSAIYSLALGLRQLGKKMNFKPRLIVTNSETLLDSQRHVIEEVLESKIYDYYGTAEYVVFASQCKSLAYHVNPLLGILEVVDTDGRNQVDEEGEMLCTTLSNFAMPLIRYRIGDSAIVSNRQCECGNCHDVLEQVVGRTDDVVITPANTKIGRLDHIYKGLSDIKEAQIVQTSRTECLIRIVKSDSSRSIDEGTLIRNFHERVGDEMTVSIAYVDRIEKGKNGKFRAVISQIHV